MTTGDRRTAWNSTLPARREYMTRSPWPAPAPGAPFSTLTRSAGPTGTAARESRVVVPQQRPQPRRADPIPAAMRRLVHARDQHWCARCGGYFPDGIELHHRRLKGMGGSSDGHAHCACVLVSLCGGPGGCHRWAHLHRLEAEAEGLIIPRSALSPWLYSVLVHEKHDAGGLRAWPTCSGLWTTDEPTGAVA